MPIFLQVRLYGSAALVTCEITYFGPIQKPRIGSTIRVKDKEGWKVLASHLTFIDEQPPAPNTIQATAPLKDGQISGEAERAVLQAMKSIEETHAKKDNTTYDTLTRDSIQFEEKKLN
jgi:hypothetical protein